MPAKAVSPAVSSPPPAANHRATLLAVVVIALGALVAYANSFSVPFIFDDETSITANPTIHQLWPIWQTFMPPHGTGETVMGRPLLNFSLALNYALSGAHVWSYHAANLLIHFLGGLLLLGLVRRTLTLPILREKFGRDADWLALAAALLWTVHPLQTESVTYIVQRAESLMGLCYLLTLYAFVRSASADATTARRWLGLSFLSCLLGMAAKEVMVTAPVILFLYDRTFLAGSFRAAWQKRRNFYLSLATTWLLLAVLVIGAGGRGGSAGFEAKISIWTYALTQCEAVVHYLRLTLWPHPLVLDYGAGVVTSPLFVLPQILLLALLVAGTAFALWRRPMLGFLGCWFFVILAPSSSIVPVATQTMAEHRVYLSLAAVMVLGVVLIYRWLGLWFTLALAAPLALVFGWLSLARNQAYASPLAIWGDTVAKRPDNARAHLTYGTLLIAEKRLPEAAAELKAATDLAPDYIEALNNYANVLTITGRLSESVPIYERVLRLQPREANPQFNFGNALAQLGRYPEALAHYQKAVQLAPTDADMQYGLGFALAQLGRFSESAEHFALALKYRPDFPAARQNLAAVQQLAARQGAGSAR